MSPRCATSLDSAGIARGLPRGDSPAELGSLSNLVALDLNGNDLSGCVPSSLEDPLLVFRASDLGGPPYC